MSDDRDRARRLVEQIVAEQRADDRARFRDVESPTICWRACDLDMLFAHTPQWAYFFATRVIDCGSCIPCIDAMYPDAVLIKVDDD